MKWFNRLKNARMNREYADELLNQTKQKIEEMKPVNIIVAGKTGSGKSTLINALFRENLAKTGVGQPITKSIERITKEGVPLTLYDTRGLELTSEAKFEVLQSLNQLIKTNKGTSEAIDLTYYCLSGQLARIEPFEIELINSLAEHIPVIIVITQSMGEEVNHFKEYIENLELPVQAIIPVLAKRYHIKDDTYIQSHGLPELVEETMKIIPQTVQQAFINAQQIDLNLKVKRAKRWAKKYIQGAFGVGFTPIPIADSAILIPMQIGMLAHITSIFGLSLDKAQVVSMLAGIGGTGGVTAAGKYLVSQIFKFIPGLGAVGGGLVSGSTASLLTMTLAYSYIEVLKQIAVAEINGRDLPLVEIQKLMNLTFKEQLDWLSKSMPEDINSKTIEQWINRFL